ASTSAWVTHRRTDSRPTPSCWATAVYLAVADSHWSASSVTRRTTRTLILVSIFWGLSYILQLKRMRHQPEGSSLRPTPLTHQRTLKPGEPTYHHPTTLRPRPRPPDLSRLETKAAPP